MNVGRINRSKNHRARKLQLDRQLAYFKDDIERQIRAIGFPSVAMEDKIREILILTYKRGRLDR